MEIRERDEIGRRMYTPELMSEVCTCTKKWGWTANPAGPDFVWVDAQCMKPSRYSAIEDCEECGRFFFWPKIGLRWACPDCLPDE